jgi:hypothetical protein
MSLTISPFGVESPSHDGKGLFEPNQGSDKKEYVLSESQGQTGSQRMLDPSVMSIHLRVRQGGGRTTLRV